MHIDDIDLGLYRSLLDIPGVTPHRLRWLARHAPNVDELVEWLRPTGVPPIDRAWRAARRTAGEQTLETGRRIHVLAYPERGYMNPYDPRRTHVAHLDFHGGRGVPVLRSHRGDPVGHITGIWQTRAGVMVEAEVAATPAGDATLTAVAFDELAASPAFVRDPIDQVTTAPGESTVGYGVVVEVSLADVGTTAFIDARPAYRAAPRFNDLDFGERHTCQHARDLAHQVVLERMLLP